MSIANATLDSLTLPSHFSYRPYVPRKRNSITPTANSVVTQAASPTQIVHGDNTISWNCDSCKPSEFKDLYDLYNTATLVTYTFVGYWGDQYEVYFNELDPPQVRGRLFNLSGQFQVICVLQDFQDSELKSGACA
jgi:hypothetical protein